MLGKGRLAVFRGPRQPFDIREYPLPEVEPDAALIKVTAANVCGSDLHTWRGDSDSRVRDEADGRTLGHEMAGRVHSLGRNVNTDSLGAPLKEGDAVVYTYFYPCQRCDTCLTGDLASCPNKGPLTRLPVAKPPHFTGAFGEYYYLRPGHFVFKIPEGLPEDLTASVNCAFSEVTYGLHRVNLSFGETIVIQGAGGLGLYATAVARERGAARIIVIDGIRERLDLAREFGADETINLEDYPSSRDRIGRVRDLTGGIGAHVVAELVGIPEVINEGIPMVRPGGRYLVIGNITGEPLTFIPSRLVFGNRSLVGVGLYDPWIVPRVLEMILRTRDKYPYEKIGAVRFPLDKIDDAFDQSEWVGREENKTRLARATIVP